ncbi:HAD family hydrolase [Vibrio sp. T11.5]|uniref:HAD family hydrolase n=1 Tax=Vibrio sp. T11.5 TaxID=2998836 RepID=UPI0022CD9CB5|nr:HAD-IA family hydrolase [Vibrio sp. T11.5]MDA0117504.1 HAD-IA family hydrolase [Vibrio sp. T11.5]
MNHSVIIFDIDGVIVDSEQLHFDLLKNLLPHQTEGVKAEDLIGLSLTETLEQLGVGREQQPTLIKTIVQTYKMEIGPAYLRKEAKPIIHALLENRIPVGFVSTAPRDVCLANLSALGLPAESSVPLISGDEVAKTKPHPDPYLAMLEILNAKASQAIVIEDTDLGIQAAVQAGIPRVYGWPHALSSNETYHQASKVIGTLSEVEEFRQLLVCD